MSTFIITAAIVILWITFIGVLTRVIEDLTDMKMDIMQIRRELKHDRHNPDKNHKDSAE